MTVRHLLCFLVFLSISSVGQSLPLSFQEYLKLQQSQFAIENQTEHTYDAAMQIHREYLMAQWETSVAETPALEAAIYVASLSPAARHNFYAAVSPLRVIKEQLQAKKSPTPANPSQSAYVPVVPEAAHPTINFSQFLTSPSFPEPQVGTYQVTGTEHISETRAYEFSILTQKFPIFQHHFLLVPEVHHLHPQVLRFRDVLFSTAFSEGDQGVYYGFNSSAGGSTINHLHIHGFRLPVHAPLFEAIKERSASDAGQRDWFAMPKHYPGQGMVFHASSALRTAKLAHSYISYLQDHDIAHVVLWHQGQVAVIPVRNQHQERIGNGAFKALSFSEYLGFFPLESAQSLYTDLKTSDQQTVYWSLESALRRAHISESRFKETQRQWQRLTDLDSL